jgi:hypothetical protein
MIATNIEHTINLKKAKNTKNNIYYLLQNDPENCEIQGKTKKEGRKSG